MVDIQKLRALYNELIEAREAKTLTPDQAQRIRREAEKAANHDPRFLASFFHNTPPEFVQPRERYVIEEVTAALEVARLLSQTNAWTQTEFDTLVARVLAVSTSDDLEPLFAFTPSKYVTAYLDGKI
jgi:hypothetical protein